MGFYAMSGPARTTAIGLLFLGGIVAASTGASGCSSDTPSASQVSVCPPGQYCEAHLTLLHTADIHSRLFDYDLEITQTDAELGLGTEGEVKTVGGVARMSYVINRERARSDRVLHLDSGDVFQGAPIFNYFLGEPEVRSMSQLGADAMVIGNHEFDQGALNVATQYHKWADFPVLGANYKFYDTQNPASERMSTLLVPFEVFSTEGLKVGVIGMGNLSTLGSLFSQPNNLGMIPLSTTEVAQFYVDLLRPYVDFVVVLSHLGLDVDQDMVRATTGIDFVLGGHNHIVIDPPQQLQDCTVDSNNPGYIWEVDPNIPYDPNSPPPAVDNSDPQHPIPLPDPINHPYEFQRPCKPRNVYIEHSGAFAKYVGRDDLIISNDPAEVSPTGNPADYDPNNGFEVVSNKYQVFPIDTTVPQDPVMVDMLQPYARVLDQIAGLDILVGFSPNGASRTAPQGGDAPLGNLLATSMYLRLGVQTDFSLTNTTGIRTDLNPGPITIEEMFNIFPFNNAITTMQLSGLEVLELFDYVARRSQGRGCVSQAQIGGARVRLDCGGCNRPGADGPCQTDNDCVGATPGSCFHGTCNITACAEAVYIGHRPCSVDADCGVKAPAGSCQVNAYGGTCNCTQDVQCGDYGACQLDTDCAAQSTTLGVALECQANHCAVPGICDLGPPGTTMGACSDPIAAENLYSLATSDYLAGGGSGYLVLKRNTTQEDTYIQQRDAITDYFRQGNPCGYVAGADRPNGLAQCSTDADCANESGGTFVCACPGGSDGNPAPDGTVSCATSGSGCNGQGLCVLQACRDQVAQYHNTSCAGSPYLQGCLSDLNACSLAGEECKFLSCVDATVGNFTDNRIQMLGR